jgi:hypothetical protein
VPFENVHACRLVNPDKVEGYYQTKRRHKGKEYSVNSGRLKDTGKTVDQSYRYKKTVWTASEARSHCSSHGGHFEPAKQTKGAIMSQLSKQELAYINKKFAKKELTEEDVFGFSAVIARSDRTTAYHTRLDKTTLAAFQKSINQDGVAMGISHQNQLPAGRVYNGELAGNALSAKFYALRNVNVNAGGGGGLISVGGTTLSTNDIERMIDAGTLFDVSVGFHANTDKYFCSICKTQILADKCEHFPGKSYGDKKCYAIISDPDATLHEVSAVMAGALPGAEINSAPDSKDEWIKLTMDNSTKLNYAVYSMGDGENYEEEDMKGKKEADELAELQAKVDELQALLDDNAEAYSVELEKVKDLTEELTAANEKIAEQVESSAKLASQIAELTSKLSESERMAKVGRHYESYLESEIMKLGVAVEGNEFDKELQKKQLLSLSIEEKEKIKDGFERRQAENLKVGELERGTGLPPVKPAKKKSSEDSVYKL